MSKSIVKLQVKASTIEVHWLGGDEHEVTVRRGSSVRREYAPTLAYAFMLVSQFSMNTADATAADVSIL